MASSLGGMGSKREVMAASHQPEAGKTLRRLAAAGDVTQLVEHLRASAAHLHINERSTNGNTALHWAAKGGHESAVKKLLEQPGIDPKILNHDKQTAYDLAPPAVKALLGPFNAQKDTYAASARTSPATLTADLRPPTRCDDAKINRPKTMPPSLMGPTTGQTQRAAMEKELTDLLAVLGVLADGNSLAKVGAAIFRRMLQAPQFGLFPGDADLAAQFKSTTEDPNTDTITRAFWEAGIRSPEKVMRMIVISQLVAVQKHQLGIETVRDWIGGRADFVKDVFNKTVTNPDLFAWWDSLSPGSIGTATSSNVSYPLRFVGMYDALNQWAKTTGGAKLRLLHIGPGSDTNPNRIPFSPQHLELRALFKDNFEKLVVVESNPSVARAISGTEGLIAYQRDIQQLRHGMDTPFDPRFTARRDFSEALFKRLLRLRPNPDFVKVVEADIVEYLTSTDQIFDVIVATKVLSYAVEAQRAVYGVQAGTQNSIGWFLEGLLDRLSPGGTLIIDDASLASIFGVPELLERGKEMLADAFSFKALPADDGVTSLQLGNLPRNAEVLWQVIRNKDYDETAKVLNVAASIFAEFSKSPV